MLVKLHHGSVRYRRKDEMGTEKKERVERPHEGTEREKKHGYFFHAKLNDFSERKNQHTLFLLTILTYMYINKVFIRFFYEGVVHLLSMV